jgi:hypothetical protein
VKLDPLDARHMAESELGFSSNTSDGVAYQQLVRAAKELRDLRKLRAAYAELQSAFVRACRPEDADNDPDQMLNDGDTET